MIPKIEAGVTTQFLDVRTLLRRKHTSNLVLKHEEDRQKHYLPFAQDVDMMKMAATNIRLGLDGSKAQALVWHMLDDVTPTWDIN